MKMITARQATAGTEIQVTTTHFDAFTSSTSDGEYRMWVRVDHWEGNGDGTATLWARRGQGLQSMGQYAADETFPTR